MEGVDQWTGCSQPRDKRHVQREPRTAGPRGDLPRELLTPETPQSEAGRQLPLLSGAAEPVWQGARREGKTQHSQNCCSVRVPGTSGRINCPTQNRGWPGQGSEVAWPLPACLIPNPRGEGRGRCWRAASAATRSKNQIPHPGACQAPCVPTVCSCPHQALRVPTVCSCPHQAPCVPTVCSCPHQAPCVPTVCSRPHQAPHVPTVCSHPHQAPRVPTVCSHPHPLTCAPSILFFLSFSFIIFGCAESSLLLRRFL